jgi:hypothetical protein
MENTPYLLHAIFHVCVAFKLIIIVFSSGFMLRFARLQLSSLPLDGTFTSAPSVGKDVLPVVVA